MKFVDGIELQGQVSQSVIYVSNSTDPCSSIWHCQILSETVKHGEKEQEGQGGGEGEGGGAGCSVTISAAIYLMGNWKFGN